METIPARVAEGGGDSTVYNPVYGQGEDHPKPIADRPGIILRHPVDIIPEQRRRERRERAQAIREALQRRAARTRGLVPPTGSPQPDPDSVYAEIPLEDVYPRHYTTDIQAVADGSESDYLLPVSHSGPHADEEDTSFIHDPEDPWFRSDHSADTAAPTPASPRSVRFRSDHSADTAAPTPASPRSVRFRSDHSADTAAPTPASPRSVRFRSDHSADTAAPTPASPRSDVPPITDSSRPGNTDENSPIYDVGYEPGDSAEFPPGRNLGTRGFRSDHSKDVAAPTPTRYREIPPPVLPKPCRTGTGNPLTDSQQQTAVKTVHESTSQDPRPVREQSIRSLIDTPPPITKSTRNLPPPTLPRGCRDHLQKTNFQQTHVKTIQPKESCPSGPETTDEYAPTHFTVQAEVHAHARLPSTRSETHSRTAPPELPEENPADVPQAVPGRGPTKKAELEPLLARPQVTTIKFIIPVFSSFCLFR